MTVEQARKKLTAYRSKQRELRKKIDVLRVYLRDTGIDPDAPVVDLAVRNKEIYGRYLDGLTWDEIAIEYKLSIGRVKQICKRVEKMNEIKAKREQEGL